MDIRSSDLFAPVYNEAFRAIRDHIGGHAGYERYTFTGGRASGKSSFVSLCIVLLILQNPSFNALIVRRYAKSLRLSVFEQIKWAIDKLGITGFTVPRSRTAALPIVYTRPDGRQQQIIFAGCDDPEKIKSIKVAQGYIALLWIEEKTELDEYNLHNVRISALRGGDVFVTFESYNPPAVSRHWCNREAIIPDPYRMLIHSTYKDIPDHWLGDALLHDIAHTKATNERAYDNIYLGIATGTGQQVFENVTVRPFTSEERGTFEYVYCGIDWGYYPDPFAFVAMSFDAVHQMLYIFDELYLYKASNYEAFLAVQERMEGIGMRISEQRIIADSAEPKSVADFRAWGANMRSAMKGVGSLEAGFKWLQSLDAIVIDSDRCPRCADEFTLYEHEIDKRTGEVLSGYPQGQADHGMAAVRYALERVWRHAGE